MGLQGENGAAGTIALSPDGSILRIGLVHALYASIEPVEFAFTEHWPAAQTQSLYDQSLYLEFARTHEITPFIRTRVASLLRMSAEGAAQGILFTGSLFGEPVEAVRANMDIPVLTAYEAMIEDAFDAAERPRLGLLATVKDTTAFLSADIERYARNQGREYTLEIRHADGAMDALLAQDRARHDALIERSAKTLPGCDAVLLAQFSMAPVAARLRAAGHPCVIESPRSAVNKLRRLVDGAPRRVSF